MARWQLGLMAPMFGVLLLPLLLSGASFEMQNEDVIVGELTAPLKIEPALGGELKVPLQEIASVEGDRFAFDDGTALKGRIKEMTLAVKTRFGDLSLPVAQLKAMKTGKEGAPVTPPTGTIFEMKSGDVIIGELTESLMLKLAIGGEFPVSPKELVSFDGERFAFQDGTILRARVIQEALAVKTRYGLLKVASAELKTIRLGQEGVAGAIQGGAVVFSAKTLTNSIGMTFVLIPAGEFMMGSNDGDNSEKPVHKVRISRSFYLGKYEVTQGQWQAIMGKNPSQFTGDPNLPVEVVSFTEVMEFIRNLHAKEVAHKEGGTKYRLPTEAEWEYPARAGSTTAYSFGDQSNKGGEYASCSGNSGNKTRRVGQLKPNAWGLHDMHGNVSEWVEDYNTNYGSRAVTDPSGPSGGSHRVIRGGSWTDDFKNCRSSSRGRVYYNDRADSLGFRLVREAE